MTTFLLVGLPNVRTKLHPPRSQVTPPRHGPGASNASLSATTPMPLAVGDDGIPANISAAFLDNPNHGDVLRVLLELFASNAVTCETAKSDLVPTVRGQVPAAKPPLVGAWFEYLRAAKCTAIVDGLPRARGGSVGLLQKHIAASPRMVERCWGGATPMAVEMPLADGGATQGWAYVRFATPALAARACETADGFRLDNAHTLTASLADRDVAVPWAERRPAEDEFVPEEQAMVDMQQFAPPDDADQDRYIIGPDRDRVVAVLANDAFTVTCFRTFPHGKHQDANNRKWPKHMMGEAWIRIETEKLPGGHPGHGQPFKDHRKTGRQLVVHFHFGGTWAHPDFRSAAPFAAAATSPPPPNPHPGDLCCTVSALVGSVLTR